MVRSLLLKFSPKSEKKLLALCKNNPEKDRDIAKWNKAAVQYLVRKLRKESDIISDLEKAIKHKSPKTKCVPLPKILDNRLLISHRRGLPQVIYCRIWRWPDLQSHHQIRAISTCQSSAEFTESGVQQPSTSHTVCVNPYHYERESPGPIDPILLSSRIPPDLSSSFEDSDHKGTKAKPGTGHGTVAIPGPSGFQAAFASGATAAAAAAAAPRSTIITRETVRALLFPQTHETRQELPHLLHHFQPTTLTPLLSACQLSASPRQPAPGTTSVPLPSTSATFCGTEGLDRLITVPTSSKHLPEPTAASSSSASNLPPSTQYTARTMDPTKMEDSSKEQSDPIDVPIDSDQLLEFGGKLEIRPGEYDQETFDFLDKILPDVTPQSGEIIMADPSQGYDPKQDDKPHHEAASESARGSLIPMGHSSDQHQHQHHQHQQQQVQQQISHQIPHATLQQHHHYQSHPQQQSPQQFQQYQQGPYEQYPPQQYQTYPTTGTYYTQQQSQQHSPQQQQQQQTHLQHSPQQQSHLQQSQQHSPQQQAHLQQSHHQIHHQHSPQQQHHTQTIQQHHQSHQSQQHHAQKQQPQQIQYQYAQHKQPMLPPGNITRQPYNTRTEVASPFSFKQNRFTEAARAKHEQSAAMMRTTYEPQGNINIAPYGYQNPSQQHVVYRQPQYQPAQQHPQQQQAMAQQQQCMPSTSYSQHVQYGQVQSSAGPIYTPLYSAQQQAEMQQSQQYQQADQMQMDYDINMDVVPQTQPTYYNMAPGPSGGMVDQSMEQMIDIQQVPFQEGTSWCSITYHEYSHRLGDKYQTPSSIVSVDGYTQPMCSDRFCIGGLSNVNRNQFTEWVRRRIGRGVRLTYVDGEVYVESQCESAIFVSNPLLVEEHGGKYIEQVTKLNEGCSLKVFSTHQFSKLLSDSVTKGFEAVYKLTNCCIIRISFVKGWGRNYKRQSIFHTPCWVEIQLNGPLQWIDKVLRQMKPPAGCGTTSK